MPDLANKRKNWLLGQDSNLEPSGYKRPRVSSGLGLSHHPFRPADIGCRALPPASPGVRAFALVSAPSPSHRDGAWLRVALSAQGGRVSLNSPDSSTTIPRGSCNLYSHPLCQLSYRGAGADNLARMDAEFNRGMLGVPYREIGDTRTRRFRNRDGNSH